MLLLLHPDECLFVSLRQHQGFSLQSSSTRAFPLSSTEESDRHATRMQRRRHQSTHSLTILQESSVPESSSQRKKQRNKGKLTDSYRPPMEKSTALQAGSITNRSTLNTEMKPIVPTNFASTEEKYLSRLGSRRSQTSDAGAWYLRDEMVRHDILSFEEEISLSKKIYAARNLKDQITSLIELKLEAEVSEDSILSREDYCRTEDIDIMSIYSTSRDAAKDSELVDKRTTSTLVKDGSKLNLSSLEADLEIISDDDIRMQLKIDGGRDELRRILYTGANARDKLMRSNIRLVVSIAKKWMGRNIAAGSGEGSTYSKLYNGSWDRPSLDETIQEGILGLARAVDKYDPDRGLRFSTYSTYWITSYIRQCFQAAMTGCLKVPTQLHEVKNQYKRLIKRYIDQSEPIPSEETIAIEIGVSTSRLRTAIRVTESILSLDEPVYAGGNSASKGSAAGGDIAGSQSLLLGDRLECRDTPPEDFVELSFLRQSLEDAMAAELSPHERDILRLRLGLDDGQSRTIRQIAEECGGGITLADVRSVERRAFKKLRSPNALYTHNLIAFMELAGIDFNSLQKR